MYKKMIISGLLITFIPFFCMSQIAQNPNQHRDWLTDSRIGIFKKVIAF